ncbi:alpha-ketoglutarate-dependent dioxygenase AlkB [Mycobacterium paraterrae]|uniref:Alpha-ketoglutarate-dependent dioxygenase AlkB n=1 Tax=Mycobacterium paraterrae TaxID=577492 RepID=A0ABY3VJZ5_9MYCO|nr:alpha-ketoglutarate-dependent dioxygenase AlkB [Mycobacterium paraterrae]UMB69734.1 alpha-ketoglutarate-dependent dioxygenase AlkB [Mycobacterium paraterrae]
MSGAHELTLFDDGDQSFETSIDLGAFDRATEHRLDDFSSITMVHSLVRGHDALLQQMRELPGWEQRRRWMFDRMVDEPRLTNEFTDIAAAPGIVVDIADALSAYCGVRFDALWMNWYRDNQDSTSWHADRPANIPATATVPVLSLGATRRFLIRPRGGGASTSFTPLAGDVLIMRGRCQRDWQHSVPKQQALAGGRISLNFSSSEQVRS